MKPHRTFRNCQAETGAATPSISRIGDAVEGSKQIVKGFLRHSGTVISHTDNCVSTTTVVQTLERDFDAGILRRVPHTVAHHVLDGTPEQFNITEDLAFSCGSYLNLAIIFLGLKINVGNNLRDE